ncbi:hypothetical protein QJS10_CPB15g00160 [Acorus calamus]|uniref:Uncharacterized protein n=1 Tax=Acorus calamus TaxID=4465 RepID=A0AAV9D8R1_ACOCL|nr:hypothetical protein QJS10_CPB15g00160 [Acorus calamus]
MKADTAGAVSDTCPCRIPAVSDTCRTRAFGRSIILVMEHKSIGTYELRSATIPRCGVDVGRSIAGPSNPTVDVNRTRPSDAMDP